MQPWKCKQGHVLGMIRANSQRRPILMLYRHAVDLDALPAVPLRLMAQGLAVRAGSPSAADVDVMGLLSGGMREIRCDVCGGVQEWTGWRHKARKRSVNPLDR
jgi:hypothetical protein